MTSTSPYDRLVAHAFVKLTLESVQPGVAGALNHIRTTLKHTGELPPRVKETDDEAYVYRIARRINAILSRVERLTEAANLLVRTPGAEFLRSVNMDRTAWVRYHLAAYVVALASVGDIATMLVADAYDLGIAPRHCTPDVVKTAATLSGATRGRRSTRSSALCRSIARTAICTCIGVTTPIRTICRRRGCSAT